MLATRDSILKERVESEDALAVAVAVAVALAC